MADALMLARWAVPTHPHPRTPDEPPGNMVVGPLVAVVDRSLDLVHALVARGTAWVMDTGQRLRSTASQAQMRPEKGVRRFVGDEVSERVL